MSIKRYITSALCILMLFSLAACAEVADTPSETTPAETTPNETTSAETTSAETTSAETTSAETTSAETTSAETTQSVNTPSPSPDSAPLSAAERQRIQDFLNDRANADFITSHTVRYPITVLGGEIDDRGRYLVSYVDAYSGVEVANSPYLMTLCASDNGYSLLSDVEIDDNILSILYANAAAAYQRSPESERDVGAELELETMAICRLDDGKYYQICLPHNYDNIRVFVSQNELAISALWDFIPIGDRAAFSIENLGKIEDSNA